MKTVAIEAGAWLANYDKYPHHYVVPILGVVLPLLVILVSRFNRSGFAFPIQFTDCRYGDFDLRCSYVPIRYAIVTRP